MPQGRAFARGALEYAYSAFSDMLRKDPEDLGQLQLLAGQFDRRQLQAAQRLTRKLSVLLFEQPEDIFSENAMGQKYLADYLGDKRLEELGKYLQHAFNRSIEGNPPTSATIIDFLVKWTESVSDDLESISFVNPSALVKTTSEETALNRWLIDFRAIGQEFLSALAAIDTASIAERAAQDTLDARDAAIAAAGQTGATAIGDHFSTVANSAKRSSTLWTFVTLGSIAAVALTGAAVLYWGRNSHITETLLHLVLVLPLIGLASYTARIAKYHQILGRWAEASSVLINSMPAFAKQITDTEMRERLILELSHGVFTKPIFGDEGKIEHISPIPPDLINLLKEIATKLPSRQNSG
ncbi:hypothetical protein BAB74_05080 [Mycobacteroides abscessus]|nr:hypothetical protein BAB74_05080 [Mycobacteroides abscessus]